MSKASRKRPEPPPAAPEPRWAPPPRWSTWLLAVSAFSGIALAAVSTWVHHQVTHSGGGYTSFCNVSTTINCDTVVTSPYASLLRLPVSVWAIGFYAVLLGFAVRAARRRRRGSHGEAEQHRVEADRPNRHGQTQERRVREIGRASCRERV